ncbi:MAG: hypothetical protein ACD_52C00205G0002 [uncultured bacterium]|nr:MAG: hypothetical protein ACD_52C00205G0002 [uncultured bacterium]
MDSWSSVMLGVLQGLTEFLPVSSSGHLVLVQKLFPGFTQPGVVFDVLLHLGTLVAVVVYFWQRIRKLTKGYLVLLAVGSVPSIVLGLVLRQVLENSFAVGGLLLSGQFCVTAFFCWATDRLKGRNQNMKVSDSFIVGVFQALSIVPAISRSGATIYSALKLGVSKKAATDFSFLLSVPAILGANFLEIVVYRDSVFPIPWHYFLGFVAAFLTGMLSIRITLAALVNKRFRVFAGYTLVLALISLLFTK